MYVSDTIVFQPVPTGMAVALAKVNEDERGLEAERENCSQSENAAIP